MFRLEADSKAWTLLTGYAWSLCFAEPPGPSLRWRETARPCRREMPSGWSRAGHIPTPVLSCLWGCFLPGLKEVPRFPFFPASLSLSLALCDPLRLLSRRSHGCNISPSQLPVLCLLSTLSAPCLIKQTFNKAIESGLPSEALLLNATTTTSPSGLSPKPARRRDLQADSC